MWHWRRYGTVRKVQTIITISGSRLQMRPTSKLHTPCSWRRCLSSWLSTTSAECEPQNVELCGTQVHAHACSIVGTVDVTRRSAYASNQCSNIDYDYQILHFAVAYLEMWKGGPGSGQAGPYPEMWSREAPQKNFGIFSFEMVHFDAFWSTF